MKLSLKNTPMANLHIQTPFFSLLPEFQIYILFCLIISMAKWLDVLPSKLMEVQVLQELTHNAGDVCVPPSKKPQLSSAIV